MTHKTTFCGAALASKCLGRASDTVAHQHTACVCLMVSKCLEGAGDTSSQFVWYPHGVEMPWREWQHTKPSFVVPSWCQNALKGLVTQQTNLYGTLKLSKYLGGANDTAKPFCVVAPWYRETIFCGAFVFSKCPERANDTPLAFF